MIKYFKERRLGKATAEICRKFGYQVGKYPEEAIYVDVDTGLIFSCADRTDVEFSPLEGADYELTRQVYCCIDLCISGEDSLKVFERKCQKGEVDISNFIHNLEYYSKALRTTELHYSKWQGHIEGYAFEYDGGLLDKRIHRFPYFRLHHFDPNHRVGQEIYDYVRELYSQAKRAPI